MKRRPGLCFIITLTLSVALVQSLLAQSTHNDDPVAKLSADDLAKGKRLFQGHCAHCHGIDGSGGRGPNLAQPKLRLAPDNKALFNLIKDGVEGREMPAAWQMDQKELWQVAGYVRSLGAVEKVTLQGDPLRGRDIFLGKGGCTACHVMVGRGTGFGPELTSIGGRRNAAYLKEALINPGATVPEGFLMVRVKTRGEREVYGQRMNEDSFTIQLRDASGQFYSFRKLDLVELKKEFGKSPMPAYDKLLSTSEIDDLVAFLSTLRMTQ